jgi:hypothetical protein
MNKFFALAAIAAVTVFSSCSKSSDPAPTQPVTWSAKLVGAQNNAGGSFFSPSTGAVYGAADSANFTANKVDLSFAQVGPVFTPKLISLKGRSAEGLHKQVLNTRETFFQETAITKAQFDTASSSYIGGLTIAGQQSVAITQGKVYSFYNAENKAGLIYVSNYTASTKTTGVEATDKTSGSVTIDVRLEN